MREEYDVIVGGGGHAGVEAAWIAAKRKKTVLLVTQNVDNIAQMSCNPSIGGLAKSHLVKEIDILGGIMGVAADKTAIQFKTLNASKGPAVWALRVQSDKRKYSSYIRQELESNEYIDIVQDEIIDLKIKSNRYYSSELELNGFIKSKALILCSGTFLGGTIHIGTKQITSGRLGEGASNKLKDKLTQYGFERNRLKTGTPPRVTSQSINFEGMEIHGSDEHITPFSFRHKGSFLDLVPCYMAHTNPETHDLIRDNLSKTALFSGQIKGTGPRYCPSIEDKISRFSDKISHRLFLEPEGLETNEYYINGFSTSLPLEIQKEALKKVKGFENVHFVRPAYAIEYDCFPAYQIKTTLETRSIEGLYFAGQINGTSGYEEAGAQGLVAGLNATIKIDGGEPFVPKRSEAYIGVLIDDLITKDIREPYRMFTSLAEYRLELRHDNADSRLLKYSKKYNLLTPKEITFLENRLKKIDSLVNYFKEYKIKLAELNEFLKSIDEPISGEGMKLVQLLKRANISIDKILDSGLIEQKNEYTFYEYKQAEILVKYEGYIKRQKDMIDRFNKNEKIKLSEELNYSDFAGLKKEAVEKLNKVKPVSVGQAGRIAGISPADISVILVNLKKMDII